MSKVTEKIKAMNIQPQSGINTASQAERGIKTGDVYIINNRHKLIIADSEDVEFIKQHAGTIDCVLTDPPYGINYKSPVGNGQG